MGGPEPDPGPCPGEAKEAYEVDLLGGAMRAASGSYGASSGREGRDGERKRERGGSKER